LQKTFKALQERFLRKCNSWHKKQRSAHYDTAIAGLRLHDRSERNTSADREFRKAADVGERVAPVDKAVHIKRRSQV